MIAAIGSNGHTIILRNVNDGQPIRSIPVGDWNIYSIGFFPNGNWVFTGGRSNSVGIFEIAEGSKVKDIPNSYGSSEIVTVSPNGETLAISSSITIELRSVRQGHKVDELSDEAGKLLLAITWSRSSEGNEQIVGHGYRGRLSFWSRRPVLSTQEESLIVQSRPSII